MNYIYVNKNVYLSQKGKYRRQNRESLEERERRLRKRRQKYKEKKEKECTEVENKDYRSFERGENINLWKLEGESC